MLDRARCIYEQDLSGEINEAMLRDLNSRLGTDIATAVLYVHFASRLSHCAVGNIRDAADALTAETGVSLDAEMSRLLEIEQAYGASARLIATVGTMFDTLMAAVR